MDIKISQLKVLAENSIVETERLTLRPMRFSDLNDYHEYTSDDELVKYDYIARKDIEESTESLMIYNLINPLGRYGIELKENGKLIGNYSLRIVDNTVEIGYTLNRKYNGKGYGTEAALALKEIVLMIPEIKYFIGNVDSRNIASIRILEKLGMEKVEETRRVNTRNEDIISIRYELEL